MRFLITGGAGFIGSHLCEKYVNEGHTVLCLDNFMTGSIDNIRHLLARNNFKLINGDIRDFDIVEKLMSNIDVVIHLAAQIHVDRSIIEPTMTYEVNVMGTQKVLEAARIFDVKKVIFASTSEVYGSSQYSPMDEKHPLDSPHPYGASKIAADRLCKSYQTTYDMDITIVRPFNIYGPRQRDKGYGSVIAIFARRVLNDLPPIIYGDGTQTRDYTYISDTVEAYDKIVKYQGRIREPINFGTGSEIPILELANMIIELTGKKGKISPVHIEGRVAEVKRLIADATKAKELLGWEPKVDLKTGLVNYLNWYKNHYYE